MLLPFFSALSIYWQGSFRSYGNSHFKTTKILSSSSQNWRFCEVNQGNKTVCVLGRWNPSFFISDCSFLLILRNNHNIINWRKNISLTAQSRFNESIVKTCFARQQKEMQIRKKNRGHEINPISFYNPIKSGKIELTCFLMIALFSELMKFFLVVDFLSVLLVSPDIKCLGNSMSIFYLTLHQGRYSTKLACVSNLMISIIVYLWQKSIEQNLHSVSNREFFILPTSATSLQPTIESNIHEYNLNRNNLAEVGSGSCSISDIMEQSSS